MVSSQNIVLLNTVIIHFKINGYINYFTNQLTSYYSFTKEVKFKCLMLTSKQHPHTKTKKPYTAN